MSRFQSLLTDNEIDSFFDDGALFVKVFGHVIGFGIMLDDGIGILTEDIDIVIPDKFVYLYVCSVARTQGDRTVLHVLHVAGS